MSIIEGLIRLFTRLAGGQPASGSRTPSPTRRPRPDRATGRPASDTPTRHPVPPTGHPASDTPTARAEPGASYPGDYRGMPPVSYAPHDDRLPDPGEVVWTWVPFEDDHSRGKDRPVLLIGRDGRWLLGLPLTSHDHDVDAGQEAAEGRYWQDIGTGPWDAQGRPSEVRLNRVLRIDPERVRRTSGRLPRDRFDAVVAGMRRHLG